MTFMVSSLTFSLLSITFQINKYCDDSKWWKQLVKTNLKMILNHFKTCSRMTKSSRISTIACIWSWTYTSQWIRIYSNECKWKYKCDKKTKCDTILKRLLGIENIIFVGSITLVKYLLKFMSGIHHSSFHLNLSILGCYFILLLNVHHEYCNHVFF